MIRYATESSSAAKKARAQAKEYKLPMYGDWYALTIYERGNTKQTSGRNRNTWPAAVFKSEAMASIAQCKSAPYLHSILIGEFDYYAYIYTKRKEKKFPAFIVTYVWDTRQIVDVQQIDSEKEIDAILKASRKKTMLAPDSHEPLKGIEKVQAAYAKVMERNQRFSDSEHGQPTSPAISAILKYFGKDMKRSNNKAPDMKSLEKVKTIEYQYLHVTDGKVKSDDKETYEVVKVDLRGADLRMGSTGKRGSIDMYCKHRGHDVDLEFETENSHITNWFDGMVIKATASKKGDASAHVYIFK